MRQPHVVERPSMRKLARRPQNVHLHGQHPWPSVQILRMVTILCDVVTVVIHWHPITRGTTDIRSGNFLGCYFYNFYPNMSK